MHHLNHVHRRGAVCVWRRRMPATSSKACGFIQVSLRTREFSTAKNLANLLNRTFCDSILRVKTQKITRAEAQQFLTAVVSDELKRIEAERYAEPQATTPQEWRERYLNERARSFALTKVAVMGPDAHLFEEDRAALVSDGFDAAGIALIEGHIRESLQQSGRDFEDQTIQLAETCLCRCNFSSDDRRALAKIRLTGQANAIAQSDRRTQTTPFIDLKPTARAADQIIQKTAETMRREGYSGRLVELLKGCLAESFCDVSDPTPKNAVPSPEAAKNPTTCDRHITAITAHGRMAWQKTKAYNQRSRGETLMGRWKAVIRSKLKASSFENQKTEAKIGVRVLNWMTGLGRPSFERTA